MAPKKRTRSPAATDIDSKAAASAGSIDIPPATWAHTPSTVDQWQKEDSLLFLDLYATNDFIKKHEAVAKQVKVASFDMDDTLVMSKTGKVFADGRHDWKILHPAVITELRQLHQDGFRIVIFTNQSGIGGKGWDEKKASDIRGKITDIGNALSIPMSAWVATKEDKFRKPTLGMWEHFTARLPFPVDLKASFYCGDAAGRTIMTLAGRKKDFSCSDRKFAINVGFGFTTPEEYFAGMPPVPIDQIHWDGPSGADLRALPTTYPQSEYHAKGLECVIFLGFPGCGKSTFFRRFFSKHNYVHINRDTLKDVAKCVAATNTALAAGKSVVIDNTNPNPDDRKPYLDLAKKYGANMRAFHFSASKEMANHMNVMRDRLGITPRVSSIAYNIFKGKFQMPTEKEGFSEIVTIPPVADFTDLPEAAKTLFYMLS